MTTIDPTSALGHFSREVASLNTRPLWERVGGTQPGSAALPTLWRYAGLRPQLMRAVDLITAHQAERRVLMLENPGLPGTTYITNSLYCGLQVIAPGEVAPAHRHTPNALRFIIEGEGAYTTVAGERIAMRPGDFVVTPGWSWHDHGHAGTEPVVWLDALDSPFGQFFGATFRENYPGDTHPVTRSDHDSSARFGSGMLPIDYRPHGTESPLLIYPYDRSRAALARVAAEGPVDPVHGVKLRYANPVTGGHPFPTMAVFLQWLPARFAGRSYRSTDGSVFNVVEGQGRIDIEGRVFSFAPHDVFVVPPWCPYRLETDGECVLFSYSDRAAQERLGFWREDIEGRNSGAP
jgi:gentisate 1,2-dioxygenase